MINFSNKKLTKPWYPYCMSKKENILIIEDDEDISELIDYNLKKVGYACTLAFSGEEGLEKLNDRNTDLVLLDIMLPTINGFEVCRRIRINENHKDVLIIMLTAKGEDADVIKGLELGADDYITKPFSPSVLIAKIKSVLKRRVDLGKNGDGIIKIGKLVINSLKYEASIDGQILDLSPGEFQALCLFAKKPGWALTRYQIINSIKGEDHFVTDRTVDVMIVGLRKKLGEYGSYIETVRGVGYKFKEN